VTAALADLGMGWFLPRMPVDWHAEMAQRAENLRSGQNAVPAINLTNILRKALSHVVSTSGMSASDAATAANEREAIAALRGAVAVLNGMGCGINDVTLRTTVATAATKARARAAK
jgi:hypothetical protein